MRHENIQAWAEAVEFRCPPPVQPPFDEFGDLLPELLSNGLDIIDDGLSRKPTKKQGAKTRALQDDLTKPMLLLRDESVKRISQSPVVPLRSSSLDFGAPRPEPKPHIIPRKQVPAPRAAARPRQAARLQNGEETKRYGRIISFAERVRDLEYPDTLFPLPITETEPRKFYGLGCTGAKVVETGEIHRLDHLSLQPEGSDDSKSKRKIENLYPMGTVTNGFAPETSRSSRAVYSDVKTRSLAIGKPTGTSPPKHNRYMENMQSSINKRLEEHTTGRMRTRSNLSRSNAIRRPSNPLVESMGVSMPTGETSRKNSHPCGPVELEKCRGDSYW